ncbi:MAG: hypothetical protein KAT06_04895 [Gammaproteobacteria bacterium]|nr:hypothetical protein [Gammaproteobacteria bacterium]
MKKATFFEGVGFALIISIVVAVIFTTMSYFLNSNIFRMLVAGVSLAYIIYLFLRSDERVGKVTVISTWFAITLTSLIFIPSLLLYIIIQIFIIWIIRSLYFYNSIFSALIDLTLMGMSLVVAVWALLISDSVFLSFWCFFLMQALFVFIPKNFIGKNKSDLVSPINDDKFKHAHRAAEIAVSKLINPNGGC